MDVESISRHLKEHGKTFQYSCVIFSLKTIQGLETSGAEPVCFELTGLCLYFFGQVVKKNKTQEYALR